jgi:protein-tyrosine phosphatase
MDTGGPSDDVARPRLTTVAPATTEGRFVDLHTHLVPSGDDGAATIDAAVDLCRVAARHGTGVLYVTPHVNSDLPLTPFRDAAVRENARRIEALLAVEAVEIRVGYEVDPELDPLVDELRRYRLERYDAVLIECPLVRDPSVAVDQILRVADTAFAAGLLPVLAHPERSSAILGDPAVVRAAAARGCALQVTAASLCGRHGDSVAALAWAIVESAAPTVVASDGHRPDRPPVLDEVSSVLSARLGRNRAAELLTAADLRTVES